MYFLAIETSCDETAAAVFTDDRTILSNVVASQHALHSTFGGVVPEIASRAHLRNLLPALDEALAKANITLQDVGAIAVHNTPGLVGALLIGVSAAKMFSVALNVPLIAVNHLHSHLYACRLAARRDIYPCIGLVVSGGHTSLFRCESPLENKLLGGTRDDAAGEAFDKVAAILGIGFPGGPALEKEARLGNPLAFKFPRAFFDDDRLEFSFSGLKTAVLYALRGQDASGKASPPSDIPPSLRADLAASFQLAVVEVLVRKCRQALQQSGLRTLAVGGGVSANTLLRERLAAMAATDKIDLVIPPLALCTDNAAMAALAIEKWHAGLVAPPDLDAEPNAL